MIRVFDESQHCYPDPRRLRAEYPVEYRAAHAEKIHLLSVAIVGLRSPMDREIAIRMAEGETLTGIAGRFRVTGECVRKRQYLILSRLKATLNSLGVTGMRDFMFT
ncbi:MAG: hypothetical protein ABFD89_00910 [Bryobacteraceae bacterium]